MLSRGYLLAWLLSACSFSDGKLVGDATPGGDSGVDSDNTLVDAPADGAQCLTWSPVAKHFNPCAIPLPAPGGLVLTAANSPYTLDTTTEMLIDKNSTGVALTSTTLTQTGGQQAFLISVEALTVEASATVNIVGDKPLIVASWSTISVAGTLDGGSHVNGNTGAGANPAGCGPSTGANGADEVDNGGGSGGGGGGGFRGRGGMGGPGDSGAQNAGGVGGLALGAAPVAVRGGCAGGNSGKAGPDPMVGSNDNVTTPGGAGGGAFELAALSSITINGSGKLLAGGAGGKGAPVMTADGGGGGGAGGYVGLDAPTVTLAANTVVIAANGGGGGSSAQFGATGNPGTDGQASASAANGGAGDGSCALAGASGAAGNTLDGPMASQSPANCGGGGGGGAVGFVLVFSGNYTPGTAIVSPAAQINP